MMAGCWKHGGARATASVNSTSQAADAIDDFVVEQMNRYQIPGLSLSILRSGQVVAERSYGFNDLEFGIKADNKTVYQLASVTKIFTSVGLMMLVDEGKLGLDSRVTDLVSSLPQSWSNIRLRHLLNHTSGLPSHFSSNPRYEAEERVRREREQFVDAEKLDYLTAAERLSYLLELPLQFPAGRKWAYNQPGYVLLGIIVEHVSGQRFSAFHARSLVFQVGHGLSSVRRFASRGAAPTPGGVYAPVRTAANLALAIFDFGLSRGGAEHVSLGRREIFQ